MSCHIVRHTFLVTALSINPLLLAAESQVVDFNRDIRSILANRCFRCHGPDDETEQAGLRLDVPEHAYEQLDSGNRAVVPGEPDASEILQRICSTDDDVRMPPAESGDPLSPSQIALVTRWIEQGAKYDRHWSFDAPRRSGLPRVAKQDRSRNAIDVFVQARLERDGLRPAKRAGRRQLIRRVTLDLIGLPPTMEEVKSFLGDERPGAFDRVLDRLLSSPAYGERWARVWLDLARYADSAGYAQDPPRTIWKYRDWVISALNENKSFDDFTVEQLAGDLLPHPTEDQLIATAFHRNTMTNSEGGTDDEEFRNAAIVDRVNTTMQVWMGLTMGCAQCHNHKYDPITQQEYFRFFAVFNNTEDADRGNESPTLESWTEELLEQKRSLQAQIEELKAKKQQASPQPTEKDETGKDNTDHEEQRDSPAAEELKQLQKQLADLKGVPTPIMRELSGDKIRQTHIQVRGNFQVKGEQVAPGVPSSFHPLAGDEQPNRLDAARWLVDQRNPLTARVTTNRIWEQMFGVGIVETSEDFGVQGMLPSHPDLLNHLALELMHSRWDTKRLIRLIASSATYCQTSRVRPQLLKRDPANRRLARGPKFRLSAEKLRDQALAVSGLLSRNMYGPSVRPPQPNLGLRAAFGGSTDWEPSSGDDRYRRGLYTSWRRTTPYPSMATFDAPSREFCTVRRIRTNTPLQALVTLNDPVFVEAAQALARRIVADAGTSNEERAKYAFELCLSRTPSRDELGQTLALLDDALSRFASDAEAATSMASDPLGPVPDEMDTGALAAWTVVANVIMNLDEFLARN